MISVNKRNATAFYAVIQALYFCSLALIACFASTYLLDRGFSSGRIGVILGLGNLGSAGFQILVASFVQRTGIQLGRAMFAVHVLIVLLSAALLLLPLGGLVFCIVYILVYSLNSSMQSSVNSLYRGYHERGTRINFGAARGCGSMAFSLTSLAAGILIQKFTTNILPGLYIIPCLLLCFAVLAFNAPNLEERQPGSVKPSEKKILMKEYPQFYIFFAGVLCLATANGFMDTYLIQVIRRIGGDSSNLGVAMFISAMTELPAMLLYRRAADNIGNRKLLIFAGWMWAAKNFFIMLAPNVYLLYAAELLQFAGYAIYVPAGVRFVAHTLPESEFLKGQSIVGSALTLGYLIASFAGGIMIELVGIGLTLWGVQLFSAAGVILFTVAMTKSLSMFPAVPLAKQNKKK